MAENYVTDAIMYWQILLNFDSIFDIFKALDYKTFGFEDNRRLGYLS